MAGQVGIMNVPNRYNGLTWMSARTMSAIVKTWTCCFCKCQLGTSDDRNLRAVLLSCLEYCCFGCSLTAEGYCKCGKISYESNTLKMSPLAAHVNNATSALRMDGIPCVGCKGGRILAPLRRAMRIPVPIFSLDSVGFCILRNCKKSIDRSRNTTNDPPQYRLDEIQTSAMCHACLNAHADHSSNMVDGINDAPISHYLMTHQYTVDRTQQWSLALPNRLALLDLIKSMTYCRNCDLPFDDNEHGQTFYFKCGHTVCEACYTTSALCPCGTPKEMRRCLAKNRQGADFQIIAKYTREVSKAQCLNCGDTVPKQMLTSNGKCVPCEVQ